MRVKHHEPLSGLAQPDPAQYAHDAALVGVHDEWVRGVVGAWRWPLLHKHRARVKELVTAGYAIDLGGAAAPVGYGAVVVDYHAHAMDGADYVAPRSLFDVPPDPVCVFASHTLEHFVDVEHAVRAIFDKLASGGHFVCLVPSWRKTNLQASVWPYHETTFCLEWETNAPVGFVRLDMLCAEVGFAIDLADADYNNIIVIARKP